MLVGPTVKTNWSLSTPSTYHNSWPCRRYKIITIRQLTSADEKYFTQGLELLNRTQGRDLFGPQYLHIRTQDPLSYVVAAFNNEELIGLGIAQILNNYDYYLPFDSEINEKLKNKKVGSFSTLCTLESFQGQGIGQKISQKRLEWLKKQGCDVIVGVSWVSGLAHTSNRVFDKLGFKPIKRVENFYHQSSIDHPFICPGCNEQPCACSAILYMREL